MLRIAVLITEHIGGQVLGLGHENQEFAVIDRQFVLFVVEEQGRVQAPTDTLPVLDVQTLEKLVDAGIQPVALDEFVVLELFRE